VSREIRGSAWDRSCELFHRVLVYGDPTVCDHQREYGLPTEPAYCGWVVEPPMVGRRDGRLLAAAAGGGGDGAAVFDVVGRVLDQCPAWRAEVAIGPFGELDAIQRTASRLNGRLAVRPGMSDCRELFARAGAVIQMAGYNSTFEALAAGLRPVLVPRRHPRREQAIRAERLARMGLADVVDSPPDPSEVARLLEAERIVRPDALRRAGVDFHGAERAAAHIRSAARQARAA
jgi:predicted glycosyltransferase